VLSDVLRTLCSRTSRDAAIPGIDGLRCYAAVMVISAHSKLGSAGWGATGVWLFFTLSGMLLTPSLVRAVKSPDLTRQVLAYLIRRIFRIMPAFIFVLAFSCIVVWKKKGGWFNYDVFWLHLTFQIARWHFWTIKTEMLLYLGLPLVVGVLAFLRGWQLVVVAAMMLAGTYLVTEYSPLKEIAVSSKRNMHIYATPFLIGALLALANPTMPDRVRNLCFWIGVAGLALLSSDVEYIIALRQMIAIHGITLPWDFPALIYPFAALTVFGASGNGAWILNNRVVQTIGVVGFSVYLWQSFVLHLLRKYGVKDPAILFLSALPLTLLLSILTYHFIEVPGQRLGAMLSRTISGQKKPVNEIALSESSTGARANP